MATEADMVLVGGIDIGNGYTKGVVRGSLDLPEGASRTDEVDLPSGVRSVTRSTPKTPLADTLAAEVAGGDFYNVLDASFASPLVGNEHRRIFGRAGLRAEGSRYIEFNLAGEQPKANQELSKVLVLGVFAAKAVRDWVAAHDGALPDREITAEVHAGLALPISEYVAEHKGYPLRFTQSPHLVTVKNFETPVRVRLVFAQVMVMPEGASAQFAINDKGLPLFELLLADLRSRGIELPGVEPRHLYEARHTVGVDIGEGTVNYPVFSENAATGKGSFNDAASATLDVGYGTVLLGAMRTMEGQTDFRYGSRKELSEFLQKEPSPLLRSRWEATREFVDEEAQDFCEQVVDKLEEVLANAGPTEVVYVYGGGAGPIKDVLYPAILDRIRHVPVCYLDASYSRHLNREGLYLAAKHGAAASGV